MKKILLFSVAALILLAFSGLILSQAFAQDEDPNKKETLEFLDKVGEKLSNAKTLQAVINRTLDFPKRGGGRQSILIPSSITYAAPNKFNIKWLESDKKNQAVSNGKKAVFYTEYFQQYMEFDAPEKPGIPLIDMANLNSITELICSGTMLKVLRAQAQTFELLKEKDGMNVAKMTFMAKTRTSKIPVEVYFYVDSKTLLPKKMIIKVDPDDASNNRIITEEYTGLVLDEKIDNKEFAFEPPKEAKKVKKIGPPSTEIGEQCPEFEITGLDGKKYSTKDFRGKPTLINVWATWCPPCVRELPDINKIYTQYKNKINVLCISDEDAETLKDFIKKKAFTMPVASDEKDDVLKFFSGNSIPRTYILDKDGKIVAKFVGSRSFEDFENALEDAGLE